MSAGDLPSRQFKKYDCLAYGKPVIYVTASMTGADSTDRLRITEFQIGTSECTSTRGNACIYPVRYTAVKDNQFQEDPCFFSKKYCIEDIQPNGDYVSSTLSTCSINCSLTPMPSVAGFKGCISSISTSDSTRANRVTDDDGSNYDFDGKPMLTLDACIEICRGKWPIYATVVCTY